MRGKDFSTSGETCEDEPASADSDPGLAFRAHTGRAALNFSNFRRLMKDDIARVTAPAIDGILPLYLNAGRVARTSTVGSHAVLDSHAGPGKFAD